MLTAYSYQGLFKTQNYVDSMKFVENSQDLIQLHEGGGVVHKKVDLGDLFDKDVENSVSFEIAFTAFLFSIALMTPRTGSFLDTIAPVVGGGLLLITLIRRMALDNVFIDRQVVFESTLNWAIYFATFLTLYVALSWAGIIDSVVGVGIYTLTGLVLLVIVFGSLAAYEAVYRDHMLWGAILFYNTAVDQTKNLGYGVRVGWLMFARFTLRLSLNEYNREHYVLRRIYDVDIESHETEGKLALGIIGVLIVLFLGLIVVVFAVPMSWILGVPLGSVLVVNIALLASIYPAVSLIEFIYVRYGSANIEEVAKSRRNVLVLVLLYGSVLVHGGMIDRLLYVLQGFPPAGF